MKLFDLGFWHIKIVPLCIGLAVGAVVAHFFKPEIQTIYQYPKPTDSEKKIFKDHNNTCYSYSVHEVDCDKNEGTLRDYPVQA